MQILISHLSAWSLTIYLKVMTEQTEITDGKLLLRFVKLLKPPHYRCRFRFTAIEVLWFSWIPGHWIRLVIFDQPFPNWEGKKRESEHCCMQSGKWNKSLLIDCCRAHIPTFLRNLSTAYHPFEKRNEVNDIKRTWSKSRN